MMSNGRGLVARRLLSREPRAASYELRASGKPVTRSSKLVARSVFTRQHRMSPLPKTSQLTVLNASPYNTVHVITVSKEDYLKAILEAEGEGETVISATLAHWLKVSPPAVTMAVRRLKKDGLVRVNSDGRVRLTAGGRKIARKLTERHHLIERMLTEIFGMEWYQVHDEAERLEHAVSLAFEARLVAKLGRGRPCPHGNLSELESPASRRRRGLVLLSEAEPGQNYVVS